MQAIWILLFVVQKAMIIVQVNLVKDTSFFWIVENHHLNSFAGINFRSLPFWVLEREFDFAAIEMSRSFNMMTLHHKAIGSFGFGQVWFRFVCRCFPELHDLYARSALQRFKCLSRGACRVTDLKSSGALVERPFESVLPAPGVRSRQKALCELHIIRILRKNTRFSLRRYKSCPPRSIYSFEDQSLSSSLLGRLHLFVCLVIRKLPTRQYIFSHIVKCVISVHTLRDSFTDICREYSLMNYKLNYL